jgi:hypothetical protein
VVLKVLLFKDAKIDVRTVMTCSLFVVMSMDSWIHWTYNVFRSLHTSNWGHVVVQLVKALRYKPAGCGFDSRWCHWNLSLT